MTIKSLLDLKGLVVAEVGQIFNSSDRALVGIDIESDVLKYTTGFYVRYTNGLSTVYDGGGISGSDYKGMYCIFEGKIIGEWEMIN